MKIRSLIGTLAISSVLLLGGTSQNKANAALAVGISQTSAGIFTLLGFGSTLYLSYKYTSEGVESIKRSINADKTKEKESLAGGIVTLVLGLILLDENTNSLEMQQLNQETANIILNNTSFSLEEIVKYNEEVDMFNALLSDAIVKGTAEDGSVSSEIVKETLNQNAEGVLSETTKEIVTLLSKVATAE